MKDVRPTRLLLFGITASFACNVVTTAILISQYEIVAEHFWQATLVLSLAAVLIGAVPVFGGMAIVAQRLQSKATRELVTRSLIRCLLVCLLTTCFGATCAYRLPIPRTEHSPLQFFLSLEIVFVGLILSLVISMSLLLRSLGFQRDCRKPTDSSSIGEA